MKKNLIYKVNITLFLSLLLSVFSSFELKEATFAKEFSFSYDSFSISADNTTNTKGLAPSESETEKENISVIAKKNKKKIKSKTKLSKKKNRKKTHKVTKKVKVHYEASYVLNLNTKKFHVPSCYTIKMMKASNREDYTGDRSDIIDRGFSPCKKCWP